MPFPATSNLVLHATNLSVSLVLLLALVLLCLNFNHEECSLQSSRRNSFVAGPPGNLITEGPRYERKMQVVALKAMRNATFAPCD